MPATGRTDCRPTPRWPTASGRSPRARTNRATWPRSRWIPMGPCVSSSTMRDLRDRHGQPEGLSAELALFSEVLGADVVRDSHIAPAIAAAATGSPTVRADGPVEPVRRVVRPGTTFARPAMDWNPPSDTIATGQGRAACPLTSTAARRERPGATYRRSDRAWDLLRASATRPTLSGANRPQDSAELTYDVHGVVLRVRSDLADVRELVDATYRAFRPDGTTTGHVGAPAAEFTLTISGPAVRAC